MQIRKRNFTLAEILVVITIIAILGTMTLFVADKIADNAYANKTKALLMKMTIALEKYKEDNDDYPTRALDASNSRDEWAMQASELLMTTTFSRSEFQANNHYKSNFKQKDYFSDLRAQISGSYLEELDIPLNNIMYKSYDSSSVRELHIVDGWFKLADDLDEDPSQDHAPIHSLIYEYNPVEDITFTLFSKGADNLGGRALVDDREVNMSEPGLNSDEEDAAMKDNIYAQRKK